MKRRTIALYLIALTVCLLAFVQQQGERQYYIGVPEKMIDAYYRLIQGDCDNLTVKQLKELQGVVIPQIQRQYQVYFKEDSIKNKKP